MVKVAILGIGVVGGGTAEVLTKNRDLIARRAGSEIEVKYILCRKPRPDHPFAHLIVHDIETVANDPEIKVVAECIGGATLAYEYVKRCLSAGKSVVTSNKELVAEKGLELTALARKMGVNFMFEASVGGGIPILHPLTQCMAANRIDEVYGILNGTTNYILTRMVRMGTSFEDALAEAQAKGYAEADPTADVAGIDTGRKTCILADLAFGQQVDPEEVPMEGITGLSLTDVKIAHRAGYRVKLLGRALRLPGGGHTAYVAPHLIPEENPVSNVEDVFNAVVVRGNATGDVMFYGKGAGALPTASACAADVMECLQAGPRQQESTWSSGTAGFEDPMELSSRHYFRIAGTLSDAVTAFGNVEVLAENGETAFLTDSISGRDALRLSKDLNVRASMRVLA